MHASFASLTSIYKSYCTQKNKTSRVFTFREFVEKNNFFVIQKPSSDKTYSESQMKGNEVGCLDDGFLLIRCSLIFFSE